jgi:hypothetical protein
MNYEKDSGLKLDMDSCDLDVKNNTEIHSFPIKNGCRCNSCESACKFDNKFHINPLKGFNAWIVMSVYFFVILATIIITCCKNYYRKGKKTSFDDNSKNGSIDFNNFIKEKKVSTKVYPINEKSIESSI